MCTETRNSRTDFERERAPHRLVEAEVRAIRAPAPGHVELELLAPAIVAGAHPGQFVHVRCRDAWTPLLRRPLSLAGWDGERGTFRLLIQVVGTGTRILAETTPGQRLSVLGPLGNWFVRAPGKRNLLVCGGVGVAPLLPLCRELIDQGVEAENIAVLYGAGTKDLFWRLEDFSATGCELRLATDDGSRGHHGFVTDLLETELRAWGSEVVVYVCGPLPMMKRAAELACATGAPCQVSLESRMGCGLGVCLGCVVEVQAAGEIPAYRRVCRDGPVFAGSDLKWEALSHV